VVIRKEKQMVAEIILLLIFIGFGYALYLIVKEGLCGQLSQIDKTQERINAYARQQKENK
jgi:hypothetical protein